MEALLLLAGFVGLIAYNDNQNSTEDTLPAPEPEPESEPEPSGLVVNGTDDENQLSGWMEDDVIYGLGGADLINGYDGDDTQYGGDGNDSFGWTAGEDVIFGGAGNDSIFDAQVPFYTGPNISVIDGGSGDDIIGFDGGSTVTGGAGADTLSLYHNQQEDAASVITDFDRAQDRLVIHLEEAATSEGSTLRLDDWADGQGANLYYGDELLARINGAQGMDPSTIDLRVSLAPDDNGTRFTDGDGDSTLFGNGFNDTIFGEGGDDMIIVGDQPSFGGSPTQGGENLAYGGAGDDTLGGTGGTFIAYPTGGEGDGSPMGFTYEQEISRDTLFGGDGNDFLLSENGNDLTGGAGQDVFAISHLTGEDAAGFTLLPEPTVITDYDPANDEIVVTNDTVPPGSALSISVWANGLGSDILAGTTVIAQVTGGQTLTVADIRMENHLIEAYVNA